MFLANNWKFSFIKGDVVMDTYSLKSEYFEMLEFIRSLQEAALEQSDILLAEKKELEYKKRQQSFILEENEKRKIPNISMFSPFSLEKGDDDEIAKKDELEEIESKLSEAEHRWEKQQQICQSFDRLKNFFIELEQKTRQTILQENGTLIDYSTKLLETQEMDRNRISRDLHDSTVQSLTSLGHKMEYCSKMVDRDPVKVKLELQTMIDLNKEIINDMREIIYDLRPMSLNNIGLVATVEAYCLHLRRNYNMDVRFQLEGEEKNLTSIVSVTLYRIIQEACNNAIRHSNAKNISVRIAFLDNNIEIDIEDNGEGFDLHKVETKGKEDFLHGFGLSTMRERTRLLSGSFSIDTKIGEGTRIHVFVPVNYTSRKGDIYE